MVTPLLLAVVMLVIQFALYQHGEHIVTAAAQHGLSSAQKERGDSETGGRAARQFLATTGRGLLHDGRVSVRRSANESRVSVSGRVVSLVPGLHLRASAVAIGPVERFRSRSER